METHTTTTSFDLPALINRCKLVILSPKACWQTITHESHTPSALIRSTVAPLIVAGILCSTIGMQVFGVQMGPLGTWRPPLMQHLLAQVISSVVSVGMIFLGSFILQKLAAFFQGTVSSDRAFSFLTHAMIPALVGGIFTIHPLLGGLCGFILGLVSLAALYYGTPVMTTVTSNKALGFIAAFVVSMILASIVVYTIVGLLVPLPQPPLSMLE